MILKIILICILIHTYISIITNENYCITGAKAVYRNATICTSLKYEKNKYYRNLKKKVPFKNCIRINCECLKLSYLKYTGKRLSITLLWVEKQSSPLPPHTHTHTHTIIIFVTHYSISMQKLNTS